MDAVSLFSCFWLTLSIIIPGTGASPTTVNGTRGQSVSLPSGIPDRPDIAEVEWNRVSPRTKIVKYSKGSVTYFGTEYKQRITLHPGSFSLEIRDLQRNDSGDYEVIFAAGSGAENKSTVRLEVYAERSCLSGCWLRATIIAVLLLILLSVTVIVHIISSRPGTGAEARLHKAE
ncbi:T-lymphocyte surface antigen Ly-9-like isoform X2 [Hemitrygon akajei]|uniref:T-lymphocyte surface antigen Ly-9-like isoform X2 n=1 Tax=Hemitrygon akajei TaxID=2704970 RepID=UPI003BF945EA